MWNIKLGQICFASGYSWDLGGFRTGNVCTVHVFLIVPPWGQDSSILRTQQHGFLAPLTVSSTWLGPVVWCTQRAQKPLLCGLGWVLIRISFSHKWHKLKSAIGLSRMGISFFLEESLSQQLNTALYSIQGPEGSVWLLRRQHPCFRCRIEEGMQEGTPTPSFTKAVWKPPQTYAYIPLVRM